MIDLIEDIEKKITEIGDELARINNEIAAFTHTITDAYELLTQKEEENHLLIFKIFESVDKLLKNMNVDVNGRVKMREYV
jgi:hypothetical protein